MSKRRMNGERTRDAASFRDPAGFVYRRDGTVLRQVEESYRSEWEAALSSGLLEELVEDGLLLSVEEAPIEWAVSPSAALVLRPEPVPFLSYCYEWPFSLYQDAALLTLEVQRRALNRGMTLKDATPFNVQLVGGELRFIDHLSFEIRKEDTPWSGYRQFCESFFAPLVLMAERDSRLRDLLRVHNDGIPIDLAATLLPLRSRLRRAHLLHLFLHAHVSGNAFGKRADGVARWMGGMDDAAIQRIVDDLEDGVRSLSFETSDDWKKYSVADSYAPEAENAKLRVVERVLRDVRPSLVWDLGANKGAFSRPAAEAGATVVALDAAPATMDLLYQRLLKEEGLDVVPLVMDIENPSPSLGWMSAERPSLLDRGPADLVLALALIHHLVIRRSIPLPQVASMLAACGREVLVEYVPPTDAQARSMLEAKPGQSHPLDEGEFRRAFEGVGIVEERISLPSSQRVLYRVRTSPRQSGTVA